MRRVKAITETRRDAFPIVIQPEWQYYKFVKLIKYILVYRFEEKVKELQNLKASHVQLHKLCMDARGDPASMLRAINIITKTTSTICKLLNKPKVLKMKSIHTA